MYETVYSTEWNVYEFYEKQCNSQHSRRCIDNTVTGSNKCVGYCQCNKHPGFLTEKNRKLHNCIKKQCFHYIAKPRKKKTASILSNMNLIEP